MSKKRIVGISLHQGTYEGRSYDYMRFNVLEPLNTSKGTASGFGVSELRGPSSLYQRLASLVFPTDLELKIDITPIGAGRIQATVADVVMPSVITATGKAA